MSEEIVYNTYEDYDYEDLLVYAGIDCIVTSELATKMYPQVSREPNFLSITPDVGGKKAIEKNIKAKSVLDMYMDTVGPAQDFIIDLEMNGIVYDVEQNLVIKARMQKEIAELEEEIFSKIGKTINLDSGREIGNFVYYELGLPIQSWSKAGAPSTDGDAMKALAKAHPEHAGWLNILAKRNDIASLYRMFIENYVADFVKPDGRVHPSYNQFGTSSFRISGSDPNLTQLPRSKHGYNLRKLYKVPEGFVFLALDFSSAEVKILGALCKDPSLLKAIKEGLDFHAFSASSMFGIDYDLFMSVIGDDTNPDYKDYKEKRQISKVLKRRDLVE